MRVLAVELVLGHLLAQGTNWMRLHEIQNFELQSEPYATWITKAKQALRGLGGEVLRYPAFWREWPKRVMGAAKKKDGSAGYEEFSYLIRRIKKRGAEGFDAWYQSRLAKALAPLETAILAAKPEREKAQWRALKQNDYPAYVRQFELEILTPLGMSIGQIVEQAGGIGYAAEGR